MILFMVKIEDFLRFSPIFVFYQISGAPSAPGLDSSRNPPGQFMMEIVVTGATASRKSTELYVL